jgi:hypothetical protein
MQRSHAPKRFNAELESQGGGRPVFFVIGRVEI